MARFQVIAASAFLAVGAAGCAKNKAPIASLSIWKCPQDAYQPALNLVENELRSMGYSAAVEAAGASAGEGAILVMRSYSVSNPLPADTEWNHRVAVVAITDRGANISIFPVQGVAQQQYARIDAALSAGVRSLGQECGQDLTLSQSK